MATLLSYIKLEYRLTEPLGFQLPDKAHYTRSIQEDTLVVTITSQDMTGLAGLQFIFDFEHTNTHTHTRASAHVHVCTQAENLNTQTTESILQPRSDVHNTTEVMGRNQIDVDKYNTKNAICNLFSQLPPC